MRLIGRRRELVNGEYGEMMTMMGVGDMTFQQTKRHMIYICNKQTEANLVLFIPHIGNQPHI